MARDEAETGKNLDGLFLEIVNCIGKIKERNERGLKMNNKILRKVGNFLVFSARDFFEDEDDDWFRAINIDRIIIIYKVHFRHRITESDGESKIELSNGEAIHIRCSVDEILEAIEIGKKNQETNVRPAPDMCLKMTYPNNERLISVMVNGESVFSTTSGYEAHMFMEELKIKLSTKV